MAKEIHYSPDMVCPYCGSEKFYIEQSYKGTCSFYMRFDMDNDNVENGEMYSSATHKTIGKYAYCANCFKRLFKVEELSRYLGEEI